MNSLPIFYITIDEKFGMFQATNLTKVSKGRFISYSSPEFNSEIIFLNGSTKKSSFISLITNRKHHIETLLQAVRSWENQQ